jgi:YHS domain-containing protein
MLQSNSSFRRSAFALAGLIWSAGALAVPPINTGLFGHTAIKGYDPVAYFTDKKPEKGSDQYSYDWMGATWLFANAKDLELFKQNPQKYAPQYGGYCAYAVAHKDTAGIDPDSYTVIGDKLYLNYSTDIQQKWLKERDSFIQQADQNWPALVDKK